ncbi:MAG: chemotaxis protein CheW [Gemmatimonadaceae bacterium]
MTPPLSSAPRVVSPSAARKIVTFRLGDDLFAADIHSVERVLRYQEPTTIPNVPDWIDGVIDYHQRVVPILNLRRRFELPAAPPGSETRILIFSAGGDWIAGVVDAVLDVTPLDNAALSPPPPFFRGLRSEFLKGIVRREARLVIFLDIDQLLSTNDRVALAEATGDLPAVDSPAAGAAAPTSGA